jgi:hypothetical protein
VSANATTGVGATTRLQGVRTVTYYDEFEQLGARAAPPEASAPISVFSRDGAPPPAGQLQLRYSSKEKIESLVAAKPDVKPGAKPQAKPAEAEQVLQKKRQANGQAGKNEAKKQGKKADSEVVDLS